MKQKKHFIICHSCDALQTFVEINPGSVVDCVCCGSRLLRRSKGGLDKPLALIVASLFLFIIANIYPIMTLSVAGIETKTTLTGSALMFVQQGRVDLATVVWLSGVFIPGFSIFALFYILISIRYKCNGCYVKTALVWVSRLMPWGMMDVFFLGVLVALVKLMLLADVVLDTGFIAFVCLVGIYTAAISSIDIKLLWEYLDEESGLQVVS